MHAELDLRPVLNQVNIVARDWQASLRFYRLIGVEVGDGGEWPPGSGAMHAAARLPGEGVSIEYDNPPMVEMYAGDAEAVRGAIIGFAYASAAAVDSVAERLAAAGHTVVKGPHDAFWGARYALVRDPDGNTVGLMGPIARPAATPPNT